MERHDTIDRRLDVMNLLWERGPLAPRELQKAMGENHSLPALRASLHSLEEEGYVRSELQDGASRYRPALTRRELGRRLARRVLIRFFGGSVAAFLRAVARVMGWPDGKARRLWIRLEDAGPESRL